MLKIKVWMVGLLGFLAMGVFANTLFDKIKAKAEQGDVAAQLNLGLMYTSGRGVLEDDREAVKWFRKAAELGCANAQNNLAERGGRGSLEWPTGWNRR